MKSGVFKLNIKVIILAIAGFTKRHYDAALFLLFFISIILWGVVFWRYGYVVTYQKLAVSFKPLTVKEAELRRLVDDINKRKESRAAILEKTFSNPFIKPPEAQ